MIHVLEARMRHSHHLRRVLAGRMKLIGGRRGLFFVFVIVVAFAVKIFWSFVFMGRTELGRIQVRSCLQPKHEGGDKQICVGREHPAYHKKRTHRAFCYDRK